MAGIENYGRALVELEPEFQPDTIEQRRTLLEREKPYMTPFECADFPGYAVIHVSDTGISSDIYLDASDKVWKSVPLGPGRPAGLSNQPPPPGTHRLPPFAATP